MAIVPLPKPEKEITLGISACLVGQKVRYNGEHKRSSYCVNQLSKHFHFKPICPEVGIGMGTPRSPIRLVGDLSDYRVKGTDDPSLDVTEKLYQYGQEKAQELSNISGYILMQKSPSCGMERVKVYHENGYPSGVSRAGMYAKALMESNPLLPVEEEGRLHDPVLRENFICRVYAYHRWHQEVVNNPSYQSLEAFHSMHKYMLMAHDPSDYASLGRLVAQSGKSDLEEVITEYFSGFMQTLQRKASRKSHTNAMLHLLGYLKQALGPEDKQQILELIEEYRQGILPLVAPMSLLRHFIKRYGSDYVKGQHYLMPHPEELGLRNSI